MPFNPSIIYLPIKLHTGYFVGEDGTIWSTWNTARKQCAEHQLKTYIYTTHGYIREQINIRRDDGKIPTLLVHQLVLETFVGPCPAGMECRHLDGDSLHNWLTNLCWGTKVDNAADKTLHGTQLIGSNCPISKLVETDIPDIRAAHASGESYNKIGKRYGVDHATIKQIITGKAWSQVP